MNINPITFALAAALGLPELTPEELVKQEAIRLLEGLKGSDVLPPYSVQEKGFPNMIIHALKTGKIKIVVNKRGANTTTKAGYDPLKNTFIIMRDDPQSKTFSLKDQMDIVHEMYHAYQDAARMPLHRYSEIEGRALLLGVRFLLRHKGVSQPNDAAVDVLIGFSVDSLEWYMGYDRAGLKRLATAALTNNRSEWEAAANEIGKFYFHQLLLFQLKPSLQEFRARSVSSNPQREIVYDLAGGARMIIPDFQAMELVDRFQAFFSAKTSAEIHRTMAALFSYWHTDVCPKFADEIDRQDQRDSTLNGL